MYLATGICVNMARVCEYAFIVKLNYVIWEEVTGCMYRMQDEGYKMQDAVP